MDPDFFLPKDSAFLLLNLRAGVIFSGNMLPLMHHDISGCLLRGNQGRRNGRIGASDGKEQQWQRKPDTPKGGSTRAREGMAPPNSHPREMGLALCLLGTLHPAPSPGPHGHVLCVSSTEDPVNVTLQRFPLPN